MESLPEVIRMDCSPRSRAWREIMWSPRTRETFSSRSRFTAAETAREMDFSKPSASKLESAATVVPPLEETAAMSSSYDFPDCSA